MILPQTTRFDHSSYRLNEIVLIKRNATFFIEFTDVDVVLIGEMHRNGIQHHAPPDDPDSFISLLLIFFLCCLT